MTLRVIRRRRRPPRLDSPVTIVDSGGDVTPEVCEVFPMSRLHWIALGVLVLMLALLPFVPRGSGDDGSIRTTSDPATTSPRTAPLTAGYGEVTPEFRATIDRVVADARTAPSLSRVTSTRTLVDCGLVRCATFEGQRYCLGSGLDRRHPGPGAATAWRRRCTHQTARRSAVTDDRRPVGVRRPPPARRDDPRAAGRGRPRRADRGRPLGRQGLAAAPPDPGRAAAGAASSRGTRRSGTAGSRDRRQDRLLRRRPAAVIGSSAGKSYPSKGTVLNRARRRRPAPHATGAARRRCR